MKHLLLSLLISICFTASSQVPDIYFQSASLDTNTRGLPISKGDTVNLVVMYRNNGSTTRTIYFDFQYNYSLFSILGVNTGTALPNGATSNLTNYFYPGYTYLRNSQNTTRNGNTNYNNCNYTYNQSSKNAIQRIYVAVNSTSDLLDGSFIVIKAKVNQTLAGTAYDSVYMNFAAVYNSTGGYGNSYMPDPKSTWVNLNPSANSLVKGNLYKNQAAFAHLNFIDSATNQLAIRVNPDINGSFILASELQPNKTYKIQVGIDSLVQKMQSAITVSDAAAALSEFGSQNLDGTFNNTNIQTGAGYLASDVNFNGKFDGGDPYLLLAHVAGIDTIAPRLYLMQRDSFNVLSTANWNRGINDYVYFKTTNVAQALSLNFLIAGDINRSHSSQVVAQDGTIKAFSFVNTPNQAKSPVSVTLSNVVVNSDYIQIPINISSSSSICGLQFEFLYDQTQLQLDTVSSNTSASWLSFIKNDNGKLKFGGIDKTLKSPISGTSTPYIVRFKALRNGASINSLVGITDNMDASDNKGNQLGINLNASTIRLIGINNF